jgi:hypothetical protein
VKASELISVHLIPPCFHTPSELLVMALNVGNASVNLFWKSAARDGGITRTHTSGLQRGPHVHITTGRRVRETVSSF